MKKDNSIYLEHIIECISNIEAYTVKITKDEFFNNKLVQDAVIRNLEIIGEATKNISAELRDKYPDLPWKKWLE